ncbi:MAG TPA: tricarballylate utilization 4Fe-4S protein TcuB [Dehalococcoidia bacterium]|nr:tricarballylate utilization 4Fe-4S protein TcuB [Dehalococcoidia bacterium]
MPSPDLIHDLERQLTVCNACRYCEGYCAVFPAMELQRTFDEKDVIHLANLCFDCRACYYACPYTPPHDYGINLPEKFAEVRRETYQEYSSPRFLSRLLQGNALRIGLYTTAAAAIVFLLALVVQGPGVMFDTDSSEGSFFRIVPYAAMVAPALVLSGWWLGVLALGAVRFWRETRARPGELVDAGSFWRATKDAFGLEYLRGGGDGCDYPGPVKSMARRWLHHALVIGVLLDFASTTVAAVNHNFLNDDPPYGYLSAPVLLGAAGGVLIIAGGLGLLWLKQRSDRDPANTSMLSLDYSFLLLLIVASVSGLALMALRATAAQGTLLTLHLGVIAALFLALPYGKFAHVVYRYAALVRYHVDMSRAEGS